MASVCCKRKQGENATLGILSHLRFPSALLDTAWHTAWHTPIGSQCVVVIALLDGGVEDNLGLEGGGGVKGRV